MRAGLLLPACIVLSAIAHVLLVAAVAVPRKGATAHGETMNVDIVPASEIPDLPEVPESSPPESPSPTIPDLTQHDSAPPPPPPAAPQQSQQKPQSPRQQAQQKPQQQQSAQQPPQQQQAQPQQPPPQQQSQPQQSPQQQASQHPSQPSPDQPASATPAPGGTLAEQQERLMAMLNLQGPGAGDGSGAEADTKALLTPQEIAAFRAHLKSCWQLPQGVAANQKLKVVVRMSFKPNGSLSTDPQLIEAGISPIGPPLVQAAIKAVKQCAPYNMLPAAKYKEWRILDINFSPDEMARS